MNLNVNNSLVQLEKISKTNNHNSGLLVVPNCKTPMPIFMYMHGTQLVQELAPSNLLDQPASVIQDIVTQMNIIISDIKTINIADTANSENNIKGLVNTIGGAGQLSDFVEELAIISVAMINNWIVVMPDYPGMGEQTTVPQPYVVAEPLGADACALLDDAIKMPDVQKSWNQQDLNIGGYSQGGYVAMVTVKALQHYLANPKLKSYLKSAKPGDGPYSLGNNANQSIFAMENEMLPSGQYNLLCFLPLAILGFCYYCGKPAELSYKNVFNQYPNETMWIYDPVNNNINSGDNYIINGDKSLDEAEKELRALNPGKISKPSDLLLPDFIKNQLQTPGSKVNQILMANNAYIGQKNVDWPADITMTMCQYRYDKVIPLGNAQVAYDYFKSIGLSYSSKELSLLPEWLMDLIERYLITPLMEIMDPDLPPACIPDLTSHLIGFVLYICELLGINIPAI